MSDANFYVRKLVSLDPERYDYWEVNDAINKYAEYLKSAIEKGLFAKDFETWLISEI